MNDRYDNPYILDCVMKLQAKEAKQRKKKQPEWTPMSKCCKEAAARNLKCCPVCGQLFMKI
jgi:hypothetical protein